jgi:hypothetical protein
MAFGLLVDLESNFQGNNQINLIGNYGFADIELENVGKVF